MFFFCILSPLWLTEWVPTTRIYNDRTRTFNETAPKSYSRLYKSSTVARYLSLYVLNRNRFTMQLLPTPAPPNITSRIRSTSDIIQLCCVSARVCQLSAFTTTVATPCVLDEQFTTAHKSSMESAHKYFSDAIKNYWKLKFHQVVVCAVLSTLSKRINIQYMRICYTLFTNRTDEISLFFALYARLEKFTRWPVHTKKKI